MGTIAVEVEGEHQALVAALRRHGLQVQERGREIFVELRDEGVYDTIRDEVVDLGLGLIRMEQRRQQLEEIFRPAPVGETANV
jgi:ABC-2 type transport system ATP-binding protein